MEKNEKSSLGQFVQKQTKYGTSRKAVHTPEIHIKHKVEKGETLQGIALKHGVTMEQIKRANKIWTNDSLFLREDLLIPVCKPSTSDSNTLNGETAISTTATATTVTRTHSVDSGIAARLKTQTPESAITKGSMDVSAKDFLSKFDKNIATLKSSVSKMEEMSSIPEDSQNPLNYHSSKVKKAKHYSSRPKTFDVESSDSISSSPELVIKAKARNKQIRSSLEKLEQAEENIFEL
ncbi:unnamed protein product [Owenia fusiformis]|uniref:Uncharacterized protein n=1 Tax=Owenia fusiformis TaxID=6347 RepID=A0A8J1TT40_OWEFU|nr:unnamed protein product [Owenia fusiformis]